MAVIVWLTHGLQYNASKAAIEQMKALANTSHQKFQHDQIKDQLQRWTSIFTGHTYIINRPTPVHRDSNGFKAGFDYLTVSGTAKAILTLPDINATCCYNPGTVVAIAGRVFRHAADRIDVDNHSHDSFEGGDRVCIARWVRQQILQEFGLMAEDDLPWSTMAALEERMKICLDP